MGVNPVAEGVRVVSVIDNPLRINSKCGDAYRLCAMTELIASSMIKDIIKIHKLIPKLEESSSDDILSSSALERTYLHKWSLSAFIERECDSKLVGFILSYFRKADSRHPFDSVYIHRFAISEEFQRKGIGTAALKTYIENVFYRIPWLLRITVQTNDTYDNAGVLKFYKSLGFSRVMRVLYPTKVDVLMCANRLKFVANFDNKNSYAPILNHPYVDQNIDGNFSVYISTTNQKKYMELDYIFSCYNIKSFRVDPPIELTEPQIEGATPIIEKELVHYPLRLAARFLEGKKNIPFVVEDTMLYIEFFNRDFDNNPQLPGYDTKRWWSQIGDEGVLRLMGKSPLRKAKYVSQIGAYFGKKKYVIGRGVTEGRISDKALSSNNSIKNFPATSPWFFHTIFIPEGSVRTLAEMSAEEFMNFDYKRKAVLEFILNIYERDQVQLSLPLEG